VPTHLSLANQIGLGIGLAVAAGLRPYLPALLAGGLARGNTLGVQFQYGKLHFLQCGWWLATVGAVFVLVWILQLQFGSERLQEGAVGYVFAAIGVAVGALLFAGVLCDHGHKLWIGLVAGAPCALLSWFAVMPLLARARRRLQDRLSKELLTLYADLASLVIAGLTILVKALGYVALVLMAWLAIAGRRRGDAKYAGLRILR
jgi:Domain of unknown function (DUF4126)